MRSLQTAPRWQQERALILHKEFTHSYNATLNLGAKKLAEMTRISRALDGVTVKVLGGKGRVDVEKDLSMGESTVRRHYDNWIKAGRVLESLLLDYKSAGHAVTMPSELVAEIQRRASNGRGGRKKNGSANKSDVYNELVRDWQAGRHISGLGTWEDWWLRSPLTRNQPLPEITPDFPWTLRTVSRHCGSDAQRDSGNRGPAAAANKFARIQRDYSTLRKAELFQLDDVFLDIVCIDKLTGEAVRPVCYVMIEVGSRFIPAFSFITAGRPRAKAADVQELICRGLGVTGIGADYVTHLYFERGHIACSDKLQTTLEGFTNGRVKIHRTSMQKHVKWVGAAPDKAVGNSAGKSVIESFNARLHALLVHHFGQLGNAFGNEVSNIGFAQRDELKGKAGRKRASNPDDPRRKAVSARVQVELDEHIAQAVANLKLRGVDSKLIPGLYYADQLHRLVTEAVEHHNQDPGHAYQGHHRVTEIETAPGVWERA